MFETQREGHCRTTSASVSHRLPIVGIILSLKPLVQHANAIRPPLSIASELVLTTATTPCSFSCFRVRFRFRVFVFVSVFVFVFVIDFEFEFES